MSISFGREVANVLLRSLAVVATIILVVVALGILYESEQTISDGTCNIAFMPIEGTILPFNGLVDVPLVVTPEAVEEFVRNAEAENRIDAILVEINSPGGTPVASERIAETLKTSSLPVVALVGDIAASGGYMVAAAADHIVASPMSDVGSIGVNMSYIEESKKNEEEGLTYVQLTTGEFKDSGSPNRAITERERDRFQEDLDLIHTEFVKLISEYRGIELERVEELADGSSMPGVRAIENNLVDSLGGLATAREVLASLIDKPVEETTICEYTPGLLAF
jgi:protease-4